MAASYRFVVSGRVQGVGFRYCVAGEARKLGLTGWVRNRQDGAVEGEACGTPEALDRLHAWLGRGPPAARVEAVEWVAGGSAADTGDFEIRR